MIADSPWRRPSAMNWVASADLPVPEGPATRRLSPSKMPPSSILSSSGTPTESRRRGAKFSFLPVNPKVREKACSPSSLMRMVCRPGTEAWPRNFMICIFLTTEFRSVTCQSQRRPSAMVKRGLSRISTSAYSPTRKVVASQLVRNCARRWMNNCISSSLALVMAFRTTVRKESTTTIPGWNEVTCLMISSSTAFRSCSITTSARLMKRTALPSLASSKKEYCC